MGNANYSISTSLTGDSGEAFLDSLTQAQRQLVTSLVDQQRTDLGEIVKTRRAIATELRRFMKEPSVEKDKVLALSKRYGELGGEISYFYATAFAQVAETLTADPEDQAAEAAQSGRQVHLQGRLPLLAGHRPARSSQHGFLLCDIWRNQAGLCHRHCGARCSQVSVRAAKP